MAYVEASAPSTVRYTMDVFEAGTGEETEEALMDGAAEVGAEFIDDLDVEYIDGLDAEYIDDDSDGGTIAAATGLAVNYEEVIVPTEYDFWTDALDDFWSSPTGEDWWIDGG